LNYIDVIIIVLVAVAFVLGFKDGFVRKLIGTIGFIIAVYLGIKLSSAGGAIVSKITNLENDFAPAVGGFLIFLMILFLTAVVKRLVHPFDKVNNLINRIIGGFAGVFQITILISAMLFFLGTLGFPSKQAQDKSLLYRPMYSVYSKLFDLIKTVTPKITPDSPAKGTDERPDTAR
jgi:membrane protein required for colicin V production